MTINLERLNKLSKGEKGKKLKFLQQFLELVAPGIEQLQFDLKSGDLQKVRQTIHFLAPQLTFFGIPDFALILKILDPEPDKKSVNDVHESIEQGISKIKTAISEVESFVAELSNNTNQ